MSDGASRILANSAYRAAAEIGSKLASLVFYVVMARKLGAEGFGVFTFGLAFVMLVTALASFGQDWILTREVARDRDRIHHYFANTLALKTILALPALGIATGGAWVVGTDAETVAVMSLLGVAVVIEQYMATCFGTFQAYDRIDFISVVLLAERIVIAFAGVVALVLGADVVLVSAVYLGGAALSFALAFALLTRRVVRPTAAADPGSWWRLMRAALPVGVATAFGTILFRVDIAILAILTSKAVVGQYGAAFRLFEATLFLSWSVGTATYSVFSRLDRTTDTAARLFESSVKLLVAATLPLAVGAAILAEPVITLFFGPEFEDGATALALLAPAIALYPIAHISASFLVAQDRQVAVAVVHGIVAAQNVLGSLVLIRLFSMEGAAAEASLTQALLALIFVVLASRTIGAVNWVRVLAGPGIASTVAAALMVTFSAVPAAAIGLAAITYAVVLFAFERRTYPDDARTLRGLIRRERV